MDHNSSNSSDPFPTDSLNFDEELLQWLSDLPPISPPQFDDSQAPISAPSTEELNLGVNNNPFANLMVANTQMEDPPPRNVVVAGSSSRKGKQRQSEKAKAVEIERQRRLEMSTLYRSLRSILPAEYIRGKRSTADHLQEAVRYIKDMEVNIGKLSEKRDTLLKGKSGSGGSSCSNNSRQHYVTVQKCTEGFFEIVLKTNDVNFEENQRRLPLSKALCLLSKEGFSVTNSISSRIGNNVMHIIHVEVDDGRIIDQCLLQQQLIDCYV